MKKSIAMLLILLVLTGFTCAIFAQVTGKVTGGKNKALSAASISLLRTTDSAIVKTILSDTTGKFEISNIAAGNYLLLIQHTGFKKYYSRYFVIDAQHTTVAVPAIEMETAAPLTLDAVSVSSKKPLIERKADKIIVNVDAFISNTGSNALEVLEQSPGVQVDNNDAISLKGKAGVAIYIDDKPTYLSGADLANYLKSLPASMLDKIEIMTTPPAKYDAAGNAGVINIKTKKSKVKGFNGNVTASYRQGVYGDSRNTFNFNYRNNKINSFGNIVFSGGNSFNDLTIKRWYTDAGGNIQSSFIQNSYIKRWYNSLNTKLGTDIYLSNKATLGFVFSSVGRPSTEKRTNTGTFFNAQNKADSVILADNHEKERFGNTSYNSNFRYQFDSTGKELTIDLDYIRYNTSNEQLFKNSSYTSSNSLKTKDDLIGSLPGNLDIYSFKTDYTQPLDKKTKLETGFKISYINTDNVAAYATTVNDVTTPDYEKTNHFIYKENINAAYINFSREMKRVSLQLGLRAENTVSKGHQLGNIVKPDSSFKRNYSNLFPTVFVSYKLDSNSNNVLNFSYSKRIDRPYYADLNPFISPLDKFTYYAGNPFLNPQFTKHFELSHVYKGMLNTTVSYDHIKDEMDETIELAGNTFISRTGNIGKKDVAGVSMDATVKPYKWWTGIAFVNYIYIHTQSKIYTEVVDTKSGFWVASLTNQFNLSKGWSLEVLGRYRSNLLDGQFKLVSTKQLNVGVQKKILKDKGTVKLNCQDIFRTRINQGYINSLKGGSGYYHNPNDSRAVVIAFTYRFSKGAKAKDSRKTGGAESEQNRVKE
ncbi:outer membrane beta-barrel protein [Ferruginibacter sp.]